MPTRIARVERAFVARVLTAAIVAGMLMGTGLTLLAVSYLDIGGKQREARQQRLEGCERGNVLRNSMSDIARGGLIAIRTRDETGPATDRSEAAFERVIRENRQVDCHKLIEGE